MRCACLVSFLLESEVVWPNLGQNLRISVFEGFSMVYLKLFIDANPSLLLLVGHFVTT